MKEKRIRKNKYGTLQMILQPHRIIKLLERFTQQELADIFEINEKTIRRLKKPKSTTPQKVGRKSKFKNLLSLRLYAIAIKTFTQKSLTWKFSCSQSTICRMLKKAGISYKKFTYQALEQLRYKNKKEIKHFIEVIIPFLLKSDANIFFLDECGFHLNEVPRRGYYFKSLRLVSQKLWEKGENQTLIFLIQITNGEKIIHWKTIEGSLNSEKFHKFLTEFNPPNNGKKNYLIMDKLPVHKANQSCIDLKLTPIKELLKSKNVEIIFLPSCTPELNPAEKCFNITRQHVEKSRAREKDKLDLAIEEKIKFFQGENMVKYLDNSIKECLMKNNGNGIIEISDIAEINSHPDGDLFLIYHKDKEIDGKLSYFSLFCIDLEPPNV